MDENMKMKALEQLRDFFDTLSGGEMKGEGLEEASEMLGEGGDEMAAAMSQPSEGQIGSEGPTTDMTAEVAEEAGSASPFAPKVDIKELMRKQRGGSTGGKGSVMDAGHLGNLRRK